MKNEATLLLVVFMNKKKINLLDAFTCAANKYGKLNKQGVSLTHTLSLKMICPNFKCVSLKKMPFQVFLQYNGIFTEIWFLVTWHLFCKVSSCNAISTFYSRVPKSCFFCCHGKKTYFLAIGSSIIIVMKTCMAKCIYLFSHGANSMNVLETFAWEFLHDFF